MSTRSLHVFINSVEVGVLAESGAVWRFDYSEEWIANPNGYDLSPHLPRSAKSHVDGASIRPVQWYFDNLLPEEGARVLLAKDARVDRADAFGLLQYYGAESAGSITLLPPGEKPGQATNLKSLSATELQTRIEQLPRVPLSHSATKKMSLAGAQHKLAVVLNNRQLFEPLGATPSTHILKPNHVDADYPHSVINEWFIMRLARTMGLDVPAVHRLYVPSPVYIVDRFDRFTANGKAERKHAIDTCQLLGIDRSFKYSEGSVSALVQAASMCRSPALVRPKLFQWLVFNVLVGNSDAHLKNISFLMSEEGVQLAPFYDLLCVAVYDSLAFDKNRWPDLTEFAWPVEGESRFSKIDQGVLLKAGEALNLSATTASRIVETMRKKIVEEAKKTYAEVEQENELLLAENPGLASTFAGELRCLRAIIHGVIQHAVVQKLSDNSVRLGMFKGLGSQGASN